METKLATDSKGLNKGIFSNLPAAMQKKLESVMTSRKFSAGDVIFREGTIGDGFYIIRSGRIMLYSFSPFGERKIFDMITTGDVIGEMAMIDGEPRSMTAECITDVNVDFISRENFEEMILSQREAVLTFLRLVVRRLRRLDQHVEEIIFQGVPSRVASAIAYLADRLGARRQEGEKEVIRLEITHAELADLVGTSREYASKFISQFQEDGLLKCSRGVIDVYDLNGLKSWYK